MSETWFHLRTGAGTPAFNMAFDAALLEAAAGFDGPVLRFYEWSQPAATFGYFQKFREVETWTPIRPLIRRPTAGGLVPHDGDWTYSLTVPRGNPWHRLKAPESYRRLHEWLQAAFASLGLDTRLAPGIDAEGPGRCFVGAEASDLLDQGRKIAGAAQRRNRDGLLIQGSIQPPPPTVNRTAFETAMIESAIEPFGTVWREFPKLPEINQRASELSHSRFATQAYNQKR